MPEPSVVHLVTGFPSFRARKMVEELLRAEDLSQIYVVLHTKLATEAEAFLAALAPAERARLLVLEGDAAAIDLGLSGAEYREVARRVTRIHHLAQVTWAGSGDDLAEAVNLGAMREVIELGRSCSRLERMVVHSSASVSGTRTGLVLEEDLDRGQGFRNAVERTLARAEKALRVQGEGLPWTVVRPTQIVGDSRTGEVDRFDGPYLLILLLVTSPQELPVLLPTAGDARMHLVPIDFVVRAARVLTDCPEALGRTFHLADRQPLTARQVFERVARAGGRRLPQSFIPAHLARAVLGAPGINLVARSPRAFIEQLATPVQYDTTQADRLLAPRGVECPPFEAYVDQLVAYVKRRVQERRAPPPGGDGEDGHDALG